jgi:hypothetical protein
LTESEHEGGGSARRRRTRPRGEARAAPAQAPAPPPEDTVRKSASKAERDAERGLRGLVGAGPSQVSVAAAMRARDASRPTDEDIAAAEQDLVIVRRHYVPTDAGPFDAR